MLRDRLVVQGRSTELGDEPSQSEKGERKMESTLVNKAEGRNIGTVKMLEEEWLSMESVDGEVLAAGELEHE